MFQSLKMRTLSLLILMALLASFLVLPTDVAHAINTPWLSVSGRYIKDPAGNNVVLRGVSLVDVGVADTRPRGAVQLINMVTNEADGWYARVVRLPVYPNAIDETPGWLANPDDYFNNHLNPAIQNCVARQIYCIIDWHYIADYNNSTVDTATRAFWNYVAPKYANVPNVIFELYNEPMNPDNWATWKQWAQPWVNIIRSHAPNNLILIGGPRWSQNMSGAASSPFTGSNLVYVAHIYPEHGGQGTWDSWFGNAANTVPFFVTEWGWQQGGNTPTSGTLSGYGIPFSNYLESKGLSWTAWVFDQWWQPVMFDTSYNLLGGENYMGQFTKDFLYQHRNDNLPGGSVTNTPPGPTFTPTRTNTPGSGALKVQVSAGGTDNNQQTAFRFRVQNTGSSAVSNISTRLYFTLDGSNAASNYVLEKYWDQSGVATVSGPTQASGSTYYFTVNYGAASLGAGSSWEFQTSLHLANWGSNYSSANDFWRGSGTLPAAFTDWSTIPAYVSGSRVWGNEPGGATNTPVTPSVTPSRTNTPTRTPTGVTVTPSRTNTPTRTPLGVTVTPSRTNTPGTGNLRVQLSGSGTDNNQQTGFRYRVQNTGTSAVSNISVRIYFTTDGSNAASSYVLEKYYDQSGAATVSGPTQASGSIYYFTVNYGTASLSAGGTWEYQTALHLNSWGSTYNATNDWWHTSGTLPASYTDWTNIPAYVSGGLVWGSGPVDGPTNTPTNTPTRTFTPSFTPTGPTPTFTRTPTPTNTSTTPTFTPTRTPTNPPPGTHLDNPFVGATFYRNVDYTASVNAAANLQGGSLAPLMRQVANYPTFVWLDTIDAVHGTNGYARSLAGHLDQALAQGANAIGIVIYDLPNRDCSALASNGELLIAENGLNRYKTEYIDVIYATISQAKYNNLRIIMVIEPDSLPNLVTNLSFAKCAEAQSTGAYRQGVQYAIGTLRQLSNTYAYVDVAHAAWLGWPSNFTPFVNELKAMGNGIPGGIGKLDGFISNTANYNPVDEPYMDANTMIGGQPVRSLQGWYDYNDYIDEGPYLAALKTALTTGSDPYPASIGMIVDTSRNGWGGTARPTGPSTSTVLSTFVMESRIDKRIHKGNWCNQNGAGIGARPTANPVSGIDAFVWVKPPGESDGSSSLIPVGPENPGGKGFDRMCDPTYTGNSLNGNSMSGALPNAPVSGRWFQAQFVQLVQNAYPPFQP
ncbi:MAG TPA: glycoside hydrolase family 6 protein [Anaerolineales bacterium]|nr:glycoside hydrolase family 6 protein [Anaerolineales bacterium]